jgi:hypothetical protein
MSSLAKKSIITAAALLFLAAIAVTVVVTKHYGGVREVLQMPAVALGPRGKQDGFALVSVTRGSPDDSNVVLPGDAKMFLAAPQSSGDTILWIAPPVLPPTRLLRATTLLDSSYLQSFYSIWVKSSAGDVFRVPWHYEGGCLEDGGEPCIDTRSASTSPHIIAAVIPSGYPADVRYFDVYISDPFHHLAHWRLTKLPKMLRPDTTIRSAYSRHGISISMIAVRQLLGKGSGSWPLVKLTITLGRLPTATRHKWSVLERRDNVPSLEWEPVRLPWMRSTSDQGLHSEHLEDWVFSPDRSSSGQIAQFSSPYVRDNNTATFRGTLFEYENRVDSVDLRNVSIDTVKAYEDGFVADTYCLDLPHKVELISGSGLTFQLPKQHKSASEFLSMSENSLNVVWHISPVTPGRYSETAAMLPDSPLCRKYHKPAAVWFDASADGMPLGVCAGLPNPKSLSNLTMVHFPSPNYLPSVIHNLKINVHQRVNLQKIPVVLTARIFDIK